MKIVCKISQSTKCKPAYSVLRNWSHMFQSDRHSRTLGRLCQIYPVEL